MDRRSFLKYAAVGAAVAGAGLVGYEFDRWESSLEPQPVRTVTETRNITERRTETVRLASVYGRLFFDYNGNGVQDGEEPPVVGASVQLKDDAGNVVAESLTDSSGDYELEDVRTGSYRLHVKADKKFRYMCRSLDEFKPVYDAYQVSAEENARVDIGLMEGFLALPVDSRDYLLWSYVDLDHRIGSVRNFSGDKKQAVDPYIDIHSSQAHPGTQDQHQGVDYNMPCGRNVVAMAPGVVLQSEGGTEYARYVRIVHQARDDMFVTDYEHNSANLVKVGDVVRRGQVIALSGDDAAPPPGKKTQPHVHTSLWEIPVAHQGDPLRYIFEVLPKVTYPSGHVVPVVLDPYHDEVDLHGSPGYWTKDNDPRCALT